MESKEENHVKVPKTVSGIIGALISLALGYLGWVGVQEQSDTTDVGNFLNSSQKRIETAFARVDKLENVIERMQGTIERLQQTIVDQNIQIIELRQIISRNVNEVSVKKKFLDKFPFPAWIKKADDNAQFTMMFINDAYTRHYGVTSSEYEGKTDFEIYPEEVAQQYYQNDYEVLLSRRSVKKTETVIVNGVETTITVIKFYDEINNQPVIVGMTLIR